jgi:Tol biopolymer transport system component
LLRGVVSVFLLILVGLGIRAFIASRLEENEEAVQAVRDTVELELKTIADGDAEVFRSRQDPADPIWQERQVSRYVSDHADQFTPAPGLEPANRPWEIKKVQVLGRTAAVDLVRWFQKPAVFPTQEHPEPADRQPPEPLPFQTTWFYTEDKNGTWFHVAPPGGYLGIPHSWHGTWLDVHAVEIEAEELDPVARDLIVLASKVCPWIGCSEGTRYTLSFEDALSPQVQGSRWALPSLYLTGLPEDTEARQAWSRALELWLLGALAQAQIKDEAISQRIIYDRLLVRLATELGLVESEDPDVALLTRARDGRPAHTPGELWLAEYKRPLADDTRLLEAEVTALLDLLADRSGPMALFQLIPALGSRDRFEDVLSDVFGLDIENFYADWSAYLADLTGTTALTSGLQREATFPVEPELPPPPRPEASPIPPGDHVAFVCDGRVWVSQADGILQTPITADEERFKYLHWSPDGRWLLTTWQPEVTGAPNLLYLLAADGKDGRLLPEDAPTAQVLPLGWSPDSREAVYAFWHKTATFPMEIRAKDIQTGSTRVLPGVPHWSPDGAHVSYVADPYGSAWVARGDWEDAHPVADQAWASWHGETWSPDGSRLALQVDEPGRSQSAIVVFDLETQRLSTIVNSADLTSAFRAYEGSFVAEGIAPSALNDTPLRWLWPLGWSADGKYIMVWARRSDRTPVGNDLSVLGIVPLDGSPPRPLAFVNGSSLSSASWSPTRSDLLAFTWLPRVSQDEESSTFLLDLDDGPVFSGVQSRLAAWSPDGNWVALDGPDGVTILDQEGHERYTLGPDEDQSCSDLVWNPAADLSQLRLSATIRTWTE